MSDKTPIGKAAKLLIDDHTDELAGVSDEVYEPSGTKVPVVDVKDTPKPEVKDAPTEFSAFVESAHKETNLASRSPINLTQSQIGSVMAKHYPKAGEGNDETVLAAIFEHSLDEYSARTNESNERLSRFLLNTDESVKSAISKFTPKLQHGEVTTIDGVNSVLIVAGESGTWQMPLAGSGFRVSITTPSTEARLLIEERLCAKMGELGRYTYGASFGNTAAYMDSVIYQMFLDHVNGHNIEGLAATDKAGLRKYIRESDFHAMITLMVHAINKDGYEITVPCGSEKCSHTTDGIITPAHLIKYDNTLLTEFQREVITRTMGQVVTIKDLVKYQSEFPEIVPVNAVKGSIHYTINLHRPLLQDKCSIGRVWCDGIHSAVDKFLIREGREDDTAGRLALVSDLIDINRLSNFLPWFKSIRVWSQDADTGEYTIDSTVTGIEAINAMCKGIAAVPNVLNLTITAISNLSTNDNPVAIGVPAHRCSACLTIPDTEFVPVNIKTQFFIRALGQKAVLTYLQAQ
jgi:hypothetical protein